MEPTKELPSDYHPHGSLDLSKDTKALIFLNFLAVILFFVFGYLFIWAAAILRPADLGTGNTVVEVGQLELIVLSLILIAVIMTLHELVHGLFFWIFTRTRPLFGFKGAYAYAAAPDWYLPRNQHVVVGLAPLLLLTCLGLALIPFVPVVLVWPIVFMLTINAAGAIGDIVTVAWLATQPPTVLVRDVGDSFTIYRQQEATPQSVG